MGLYRNNRRVLFLGGVAISIGVGNVFLQFLFVWIALLAGAIFLFWKYWVLSEQVRVDVAKHKEEQGKMTEEIEKHRRRLLNYERTMDAIGGAVYSINLVENRFDVTDVFTNLLGVTGNLNLEESIKLWKSLIHQDDVHRVMKFENDVLTGKSSAVEYQVHHPSGEVKWVLHSAISDLNSSGLFTQVSGHIMDITERKQVELQWKQMAFFDELTDLPNRKALDSHISKMLARCKRHFHPCSIMFIDLDGFKNVNDTLGHDAGDQLLKEVAQRLKNCVREEDLIARIGGDEFVVVFEESDKSEIEEISKRIIRTVEEPYSINDTLTGITVSLGISMYPEDGDTKETLLENADKAMYYAKNNGKNNYQLYSPELQHPGVEKTSFLEKWKNVMQNSFFNFS